MEYKQIKQIMDDMENSKLDSLSIEFPDGTKISMSKSVKKEGLISDSVVNQTIALGTENMQVATKSEENYKVVKSPMVGTFFSSSSPNADPLVKVGDIVHKGQVLCIIEAMKLMNEIESEFDGEVVEICVKNEDMVEYGMPLIKIK